MPPSFLFYDLETFGQDPRRTRIAQFAAVRTDTQLNVIEEPISFLVKPADDLLPSPYATLITGITPQHAQREGINEAAAFAHIAMQMTQPHTCSLGYNPLRFDDEFIRYGLFRHFYDPYEREWRNGNSRWDLLDMLRLMHAVRPEGIHWPTREDGAPSFKLEHLALANHAREGTAHEALSDVYATISMARKFRAAQPRLWNYALQLRDKRFCANLLDITSIQPVLHISQRYPATQHCAAAVLPLTTHPHINNRIIVFDLNGDIDTLLRLSAEDIADHLYTPALDLPEGEQRIPLKEVHLNKVPALIAWNHLRASDFTRLGMDPSMLETKAAQLRACGPDLAEKVRHVFSHTYNTANDADASLYDGFLTEEDRRLLPQLRASSPDTLATFEQRLRDPRLIELLFRYRARNFPETLSCHEQTRWDTYRRRRLTTDTGLSELTFDQYHAQIAELRITHSQDATKQPLLDQLAAWGSELSRTL
ncbi:exodeoxyribonuclease I [Xylella fastidiosa]|uniref:exodeoxyribonuclease I n=1 Tax=Xylella fastidiosa TaxID=2371 RepID=UPI00073371F7|nr:exodeoxyribonuclease I [Xylella fastidiosa]